MSEQIENLKTFLQNHRQKHPKTKRFPEAFWNSVLNLSKTHDTRFLAEELGISKLNLDRRLKMASYTLNPSVPIFIDAPKTIPVKTCLLELEYSSGLKIKIYPQ